MPDNTTKMPDDNTYKEEEKLSEWIRFKAVDTNPDAVYGRLQQRITDTRMVKTGVSPVWIYFSVAASIALFVVSGLFFHTYMLTKPLVYTEVISTAGSKTQVRLPDSTVVWLNGNTRIRYPESFDGKTRQVELTGEAFFNVTKDKAKPFVVELEGMSVQVLGTEFNILSNGDSDMIETTLISGSIALFGNNNHTSIPDRILAPGEQALFSKQSGEMEVRLIQPASYTSWITGNFYFGKITFGEIIRTLERSFNVTFHLADESLKDIYLNAQFTHQESLDKILSILQISMKYRYEINNRDVFIR